MEIFLNTADQADQQQIQISSISCINHKKEKEISPRETALYNPRKLADISGHIASER